MRAGKIENTITICIAFSHSFYGTGCNVPVPFLISLYTLEKICCWMKEETGRSEWLQIRYFHPALKGE